jgi:hypothetical protein
MIGLQEDREAIPDTPRPAQRGRDEQFTDKQFTDNRSERLTAMQQVNSPGLVVAVIQTGMVTSAARVHPDVPADVTAPESIRAAIRRQWVV